MRTAALALVLFAAAFLLHWTIWRIRRPRRQSAALLVILLGALPIELTIITLLPALRDLAPQGFWELTQVASFHVAAALAYIVAYSAIEARSPSMALLTSVADAGDQGCGQPELRAVLRGQDPVGDRLAAMVAAGMIEQHGNDFCLTIKGWAWARCFSWFRRFFRLGKGG